MSILFQSVKVIDSQSKYNNKTVDVLVNKGVIKSIGKNILVYRPIPGEQRGCVDLIETTNGRVWTI